MSARTLRVGMLGAGTVGSAVIRLLSEHREEIELRSGCSLEVTRVAVRDPAKPRGVDPALVAASAAEVVAAGDVDIVCELMGGVEPARTLILDAFDRGKPVVTANKELLANHGRELLDAADAKGVDLYFEASVAGGVPLIRPLKESLTGERLHRLIGIVSGNPNF